MDYKAFEEMNDSIPEKTEMDKLIDYLKICPPKKYTYSVTECWGVHKLSLWTPARANELRIVFAISEVMDMSAG